MNKSASNSLTTARLFLAACLIAGLGAVLTPGNSGSAAGTGSAGTAQTPPATLYMIDEDGCPYCERWREEVGIAYPKTSEGKFAPLKSYDIRDKKTAELGRVVYTPTFIVITADGREIGRILGYPGVDFFWPMLDDILAKAGYKPDAEEAVTVPTQ